VVRGEKIFELFLDGVETRYMRIVLRPGMLMILPPGIRHRVTTTQFTVAVAGNFLPGNCWVRVCRTLRTVNREDAQAAKEDAVEGMTDDGERVASATFCMFKEAQRLLQLSDNAFLQHCGQKCGPCCV
jgi:hypothetical protein